MASFPGAKVHRVSRRRLGRGQHPSAAPVVVTITFSSTAATATLAFNQPVVIAGLVPTVQTHSGTTVGPVSQTVSNSTSVVQTFAATPAAVTTMALAANVPQVLSTLGGPNAAASATV